MFITKEFERIIKGNDTKLIKTILSCFPVNVLNKLEMNEEWHVLDFFVKEGDLEVVKHLVACGVDIHKRDRVGDNLFYAVSRGRPKSMEMFQYLLSQKVNINNESIAGNTPLIWTATNSVWEFADILIQKGADPKKIGTRNRTFGSMLVRNGNTKWIDYFMKKKDLFTDKEIQMLKAKRLELLMN